MFGRYNTVRKTDSKTVTCPVCNETVIRRSRNQKLCGKEGCVQEYGRDRYRLNPLYPR